MRLRKPAVFGITLTINPYKLEIIFFLSIFDNQNTLKSSALLIDSTETPAKQLKTMHRDGTRPLNNGAISLR